jgi:hypothetical protein
LHLLTVAKELPPYPSEGGSYLLDAKKNQWALIEETPADLSTPESTNGTDTQAPIAGKD